jgi:ribosome-associated protein
MSNEDPQERTYSERPNKTALKRELAARSALLEQATQLSDAELQRLGLAEEDIEEIARVRAIKPSGARNRQLKFCVKTLAEVDLSALETYLNDRHSQQLALNQAFHKLEQWRDRLIEEGDALLGEAVNEWPHLDRQQFRQLVRDAKREQEHGKPAGAKKKLFRHLRDLSENAN